jgi:hypothetical protein
VRLAIESFLHHLRGQIVLLHEDNTAVVVTLFKLTTRSLVMMTELRRLWHLLDVKDMSIRPNYIRSAISIWADILSRELDRDDCQLNPRIFSYLQAEWGPNSIDRFAHRWKTQSSPASSSSGASCRHVPDATWKRQANYYNPPWAALPSLCAKLHQSGA